MCTVTWRFGAEGFDLFGNRDELRRRPRAEPPVLRRHGDVSWIAPRDPEGGGSWVLVNDRGVAVTLLNGDRDGRMGGPPRSRGLLVEALADVGSAFAAVDRVRSADLGSTRAFHLVALDAGGDVGHVRWEAGELRVVDSPAPPVASSSFRPPEVRGSRESLWSELARRPLGVEDHLAFHRSHLPERGPRSPCMHRPDARTVSFWWISVERDGAVFRYADGPPCRTEIGESARLRLRTPA